MTLHNLTVSITLLLVLAACARPIPTASPTDATTSPPTSADILFVWNRPGYAELWTIDAASGKSHLLYRAPDLSMDFAPSPDGRSVAFIQATDDEAEGLWVMDCDGRNPRQLYHHEARYTVYHNPAWTPDGRFIYFDLDVVDDAQEIAIYRIPAEGGEVEMVAKERLQPVISPDGRRLLSGPQLAFSDLNGGNLQPLLPVGKQVSWHCARFSPDGRWIALCGDRGEWTSNVYVAAVDGAELRQLTHLVNVHEDGEVGGLTWTSDGRQIVYSIHGGPHKARGIWVIDADGGQPRRLLASKTWLRVEGRLAPTDMDTASPLPTPASAEEAALINLYPLTTSGLAWFGDWAPDGESLVYTVATEPPLLYGRWPELQVWWMRADGSGARRFAQGHSPFFSADGRTVFFQRSLPDSGLSELWAVDVEGQHERRLLKPIGGLTVHQLDDGRLVVSESGTYAPLRLFDPATGTLSDLSGPWPTNFPEEARLSPDGTRLAYPHEQEQAVYLAEADGSNPQVLSRGGGFSARVWWSPDSQRLAYTTGNHWTDRLMVADRDGGNQVVLLPSLKESGYIASLSWSSDSSMLLVAAEAYGHQMPRPTRLLLLDTDGSAQRQLLEAYLHDASWSPDGRTLALSRWGGPQGELASHNIWLATLTDRATVAELPPPTPEPLPTATPPLPLPGADLSPEQVIRRFWTAIDAGDHLTAWACLATQRRARQGLAYFAAEWQCLQEAHVVDIRPMYTGMEAGAERQMFQVRVYLEMTEDCFYGLAPGPFTVLVRETPDGPWLIDSFNTGP